MSTSSDDRAPEQGGFDQTNSLAGDQLGESDGTEAGETQNAADRDDEGDLGASDPEGPAILPRTLGQENSL